MKAVVLHGPGDLRVESVPDPVLPAGGLIVRPATVGVCGSDVRTWRYGNPRLHGPQVLGHEVGGVVVQTAVPGFDPGMPVAVCPGAPCLQCRFCQAGRQNLCIRRKVLGYDTPGGMAEAFAVPIEWVRAGCVVPLGPTLPVAYGAVAEPLHTVLNGQDQARVRPGESVLVLGLGPIGVLHLAVARSRGASPVVGVDLNAGRVAAAADLFGESHVIRLEPGWEDAARGRTNESGGFDVVVIATGARDAVAAALTMAAPLGRILAFAGMPADQGSVEVDFNAVHYRQLTLVGAFGGTPPHFRRAVRWLSESPLDLARYTPIRYPLDAALEAFESVARGDGLKTLLEVSCRTAVRIRMRRPEDLVLEVSGNLGIGQASGVQPLQLGAVRAHDLDRAIGVAVTKRLVTALHERDLGVPGVIELVDEQAVIAQGSRSDDHRDQLFQAGIAGGSEDLPVQLHREPGERRPVVSASSALELFDDLADFCELGGSDPGDDER
ncbi:MAG TPA: alcohol dehydrogenase catalytic domain-containing protein, partial [Candidatus Saccharimonadales bacterium]|nr:alcohol dehydrogenase catalytic domain-containing protein [Candidatus Saccharimonadales bacterium]